MRRLRRLVRLTHVRSLLEERDSELSEVETSPGFEPSAHSDLHSPGRNAMAETVPLKATAIAAENENRTPPDRSG